MSDPIRKYMFICICTFFSIICAVIDFSKGVLPALFAEYDTLGRSGGLNVTLHIESGYPYRSEGVTHRQTCEDRAAKKEHNGETSSGDYPSYTIQASSNIFAAIDVGLPRLAKNNTYNGLSFIFQSNRRKSLYQLFFIDFSDIHSEGNVMLKKLPADSSMAMFLVDSCNGLLCMQQVGRIAFGFHQTRKHYKVVQVVVQIQSVTRGGRMDVAASSSIHLGCFHHLMVLRGCLSASAYHNNEELEIWDMKEYGIKESWIKIKSKCYMCSSFVVRLAIPNFLVVIMACVGHVTTVEKQVDNLGTGSVFSANFSVQAVDYGEGIHVWKRLKQNSIARTRVGKELIYIYSRAARATAFRLQTEKLGNDLKNAARITDEKMDDMEMKTKQLLQSSNNILTFESELKTGQEKMKSNLKERMVMLSDSYRNLGERLDGIKEETVEVEKKISKMSDAMSEKMSNLQIKAERENGRHGNENEAVVAELKQHSKFSYNNRPTIAINSGDDEECVGPYGYCSGTFDGAICNKKCFFSEQQLEQSHDHLVENSKSILPAQEAFEFKQAHMFAALDKLFNLHNAMLQTYIVRTRLYIGLCASFMIQIAILRYPMNSIEQQTWLINLLRLLYTILASAQLLFAIYSYRDYERLNHQMQVTLIDKFNSIKTNSELCWDSDSDVDWPSWIDTDLPDNVDNLKDPDYMVPFAAATESEGNSIKYPQFPGSMISDPAVDLKASSELVYVFGFVLND
ncbi:hypothetical protein F3Y22_tig00117034pilonHSYRG00100 [Hibiscus syriacus]|uniref:Uncharacterized protein n=1 Tax=Hibiscus syriacus TaxID=106335 RepID=A0A6A2WAI4_HIBSY|nr:hypothetical protein F3Y22_tig00117034pilonHSYRG00100 [Hibiscus syriacus]